MGGEGFECPARSLDLILEATGSQGRFERREERLGMEVCGSSSQIPFPNASDLHAPPRGGFIPSAQDWSPIPDLGFCPQSCDVHHCHRGGRPAVHGHGGSLRHPNQATAAEDPKVHDAETAAGNGGEVARGPPCLPGLCGPAPQALMHGYLLTHLSWWSL